MVTPSITLTTCTESDGVFQGTHQASWASEAKVGLGVMVGSKVGGGAVAAMDGVSLIWRVPVRAGVVVKSKKGVAEVCAVMVGPGVVVSKARAVPRSARRGRKMLAVVKIRQEANRAAAASKANAAKARRFTSSNTILHTSHTTRIDYTPAA